MNQKVQWWHWAAAGCLVLVVLFLLKSWFLTETYITPPTPRANGLTDEQVKKIDQDEAAALRQEAEKHKNDEPNNPDREANS